MIVRLVPYSEVFVTVTMSLDEAATLCDALTLAAISVSALPSKGTLGVTATQLQEELDAAMRRAAELQDKRGY